MGLDQLELNMQTNSEGNISTDLLLDTSTELNKN
jgi:hypothetical protein